MEEVVRAIDLARSNGMGKENYWLYFKFDGTKVDASQEENKRKDYLGIFVEDDTRLPGVMSVAEKKTKWRMQNV